MKGEKEEVGEEEEKEVLGDGRREEVGRGEE